MSLNNEDFACFFNNFSNSTGGDLVAIGKMNLPIEKNNTTTVIIEIAFDL